MNAVKRLAIIGAGSWGTALSIVLAPRFDHVRLWVHEAELAARITRVRENPVFLPGLTIPRNVDAGSDLEWAVDDAEVVLSAMPSRFVRDIYTRMLPRLGPPMRFVSATKGLEQGTLMRMSEVIRDVAAARFEARVAALSGPTFAREIAQGQPAAVVIASTDAALASALQTELSGPTLRLYTNDDPIGVEIAAALKNVIAIGAGICQGLGLGSNSIAALITRGLAEMTRLAVAMGGKPRSLAGLAGVGDLVLTCTGELSRNRRVGIELANGRSLKEIVGSMTMIAEGVETTGAAVELAYRFRVDMPITQKMGQILTGGVAPREAIRQLMERTLKDE